MSTEPRWPQGRLHGDVRSAPAARRLVIALVVATVIVSAVVRVVDLGAFRGYVFDEYYYAHDAKVILDGRNGPLGDQPWKPGEQRSLAHPELAELAIAAGIATFGDGPWGWRLPAAIAGTLLIALVYPLARRLYLPPLWALAATVLAASDTMLIVESRLGVLDMFVALWSALAVYLALRYVQTGWRARWLGLCGVAVGCAVASKWSGALAIVAVVAVLALFARQRGRPSGARLAGLLAALLVAVPLGVYVASYTAYFAAGHTVGQWLHLQGHMVTFNWEVRGAASFASRPATWIFDAGPIWYEWLADQRGTVGLLSIGDPLLWWAAVPSFVALAVLAATRRDRRLALAPLLVAALYLPWLATSRQAYIYYMTPAVPFLAVLVATALFRLAGRERVSCRSLVASFALGMAAVALWYPLAELLPGALGAWPALVSRVLAVAMVGVAAAAVVAARRRAATGPPPLRAWASWFYTGATAGIATAFVPFLLALPVSFEYYRQLTWFTSWR